MLKNKLDIIAVIPARGGSKGIPKKNIINFCGKPLLAWTIEQALGSRLTKDVYVSSDADDILNISKRCGAEIIRRPKRLALDNSSSEEALKYAITFVERNTGEQIGIVVFLQASSPIRTSEDIDNAIKLFISKKADSLFSAAILEGFCIWKYRNNKLVSLTYDYQNRDKRQDRQPLYLENGSMYIFKPEVLKKYNNRLGGKIAIYTMDYWKSYQIDTVEDMKICGYFMRNKILKKQPRINIEDIRLIVYDFGGVMTDNKVIIFEDGRESIVANRSDGLGVEAPKKMGISQIILSTESNDVVRARAKKLNLSIIYACKDKKSTLIKYCKKRGYNLSKVVYVGNDINDLEAMEVVGYPIAPADAQIEIKKIAKIVTKARGGDGVIREVLDFII